MKKNCRINEKYTKIITNKGWKPKWKQQRNCNKQNLYNLKCKQIQRSELKCRETHGKKRKINAEQSFTFVFFLKGKKSIKISNFFYKSYTASIKGTFKAIKTEAKQYKKLTEISVFLHQPKNVLEPTVTLVSTSMHCWTELLQAQTHFLLVCDFVHVNVNLTKVLLHFIL